MAKFEVLFEGPIVHSTINNEIYDLYYFSVSLFIIAAELLLSFFLNINEEITILMI